jgi:hypothetical protein
MQRLESDFDVFEYKHANKDLFRQILDKIKFGYYDFDLDS